MPFVLTHCLFLSSCLNLEFHFITGSLKELVLLTQDLSQMPFLLWNFHYIFHWWVRCSPLWVHTHSLAWRLYWTFLFTISSCGWQTSWKHSPRFAHACISSVWHRPRHMMCLFHGICYFVFHEIHIKNIHRVCPCFLKHKVSIFFLFKRDIIESDCKYFHKLKNSKSCS